MQKVLVLKLVPFLHSYFRQYSSYFQALVFNIYVTAKRLNISLECLQHASMLIYLHLNKTCVLMAWTTEHVTFKAVFCSTDLQTCTTVVSGVTLNFVDFASLLVFWVKKSKQWPVHETRSDSNTFSFTTDQYFQKYQKSTKLPSTKALIVHGTKLNTNFLLKCLTISAKFMFQLKIWQLE